jgi:hypothetical protein
VDVGGGACGGFESWGEVVDMVGEVEWKWVEEWLKKARDREA